MTSHIKRPCNIYVKRFDDGFGIKRVFKNGDERVMVIKVKPNAQPGKPLPSPATQGGFSPNKTQRRNEAHSKESVPDISNFRNYEALAPCTNNVLCSKCVEFEGSTTSVCIEHSALPLDPLSPSAGSHCSVEIRCGYGKLSKSIHTASQTDENTTSGRCKLPDKLSNPPTSKEKEDKETQTDTLPTLSQATQTMNTTSQHSTQADNGGNSSVSTLAELDIFSESVCDTKYVTQEHVKKEIAFKSDSFFTIIDVPQVKYKNIEKDHATKRESDYTTFGLVDELKNKGKRDSEPTEDDLQAEYEYVDNMEFKIDAGSTKHDTNVENGNPASYKKIFNINYHAHNFISSYNSSYFICPKTYESSIERFKSIDDFNNNVPHNKESIELNNSRYSKMIMNDTSQTQYDFSNELIQNNRLKYIKNNYKNSIIDYELNNSINEVSNKSSSDLIILFDKCKSLRRTYSTTTLPSSLDKTADFEKIDIFNNNNKQTIRSPYFKGMKQIETWFNVINSVIKAHTGVNTYAQKNYLSHPIVLRDRLPMNVFSENSIFSCQQTESLSRLESQDYLSYDVVLHNTSNYLNSESSLDYCQRTNDNVKHQKSIFNIVNPNSSLLQDDFHITGQHPKSLKGSGDNTNLFKEIRDSKRPSLETITSPDTIQMEEDQKESIQPLKKRNISKLLCIENMFLRRGNSKAKQSKEKKSRKLFCFGC